MSKKDYGCDIGDRCSFWGDKLNNESCLIFYKSDGDYISKQYEYMEFKEMLEIAEKYLLLM